MIEADCVVQAIVSVTEAAGGGKGGVEWEVDRVGVRMVPTWCHGHVKNEVQWTF